MQTNPFLNDALRRLNFYRWLVGLQYATISAARQVRAPPCGALARVCVSACLATRDAGPLADQAESQKCALMVAKNNNPASPDYHATTDVGAAAAAAALAAIALDDQQRRTRAARAPQVHSSWPGWVCQSTAATNMATKSNVYNGACAPATPRPARRRATSDASAPHRPELCRPQLCLANDAGVHPLGLRHRHDVDQGRPSAERAVVRCRRRRAARSPPDAPSAHDQSESRPRFGVVASAASRKRPTARARASRSVVWSRVLSRAGDNSLHVWWLSGALLCVVVVGVVGTDVAAPPYHATKPDGASHVTRG